MAPEESSAIPEKDSSHAPLLCGQPWVFPFTIAVGLATLLVLGMVLHRAERAADQAAVWRARALQVTGALADLRFQLSDRESLARGFILTGDPRHLDRRRLGLKAVNHDLLLLRKLVSSGAQRYRLDRLEPLVAAHLALDEGVLEVWRRDGAGATGSAIVSGRTEASAAEIRRLIRTLEKGQDRLLARGEARLRASLLQARWTLLVGTLWSVPLLVLLVRWLRRKMPQWKEMVIELQQARA